MVTTLLHALLAYVNLLVLIPYFFQRRKWVLYFVFYIPLFAGVILSIAAYQAFYVDKSPLGFNQIFAATMSSSVVVTMIAMLKFMQEWYLQQKRLRELAFNKLEAEHKMLRMQVNPHFLFNALNNIYYLAYKKSEATAPSILKLSDLMRFLLYESDHQKIPLQKEIEYIQNYIGLMELKLEDAQQKISFQLEGDLDWEIEPLLIIPFIENAFKHGNLEDENGSMELSINSSKENLKVVIQNTFDAKDEKKDEVGGVGIENVTSRLQAYYREQYSLKIDVEGNIYKTFLTIEKID